MNFFRKAQSLIPAEVRMISGCDDEQTSADVGNVTSSFRLPDPAGRSGGACTSALLDILYANSRNGYRSNLSFQEILLKLRGSLVNDGYSQVPQLTSSRPLDVHDTPFHLVGGNGQRRALLVGINYIGQEGELSGCHNDVKNVEKYIKEVHGFPSRDVTILMDDGWNEKPTKGNIINELQKLVQKSVAGDSVFFHYSGHGGTLFPDKNFFKKNTHRQFDETLIPLDYERSGHIRDFNLFTNFVQPMAAGVTITCLVDCCHSGSVLDLPYTFRADGTMDRMMESFDTLSNLAYLVTLAGGLLPRGFEDVAEHIGNVVGEDMKSFIVGAADVAQTAIGVISDVRAMNDTDVFGVIADRGADFEAFGLGRSEEIEDGEETRLEVCGILGDLLFFLRQFLEEQDDREED